MITFISIWLLISKTCKIFIGFFNLCFWRSGAIPDNLVDAHIADLGIVDNPQLVAALKDALRHKVMKLEDIRGVIDDLLMGDKVKYKRGSLSSLDEIIDASGKSLGDDIGNLDLTDEVNDILRRHETTGDLDAFGALVDRSQALAESLLGNQVLQTIHLASSARQLGAVAASAFGAGFGGSVSALRLSEKGYRVAVLEKGKRYESQDFPNTNWNLRKYFWIPQIFFYGIQCITLLKNIFVLHGTGVGGGSLVYANTHLIPSDPFFQNKIWAHFKDWKNVLMPFYEKAKFMLGSTPNPCYT